MKENPGKIGIDIGAVSLKAVRLASDGSVGKSFYARHRGEPAKALEAALAELFRALKPGGFLAIVEVIFDPHFQPRATVTDLAVSVGFSERAFFGRSLAYVIHFAKPD